MANEKRLISIDEALKATHSELYWTESQQAAVRSFLVKQPKVDAVELPCKVGDMVYRKDGAWNVVGFECNRGGGWRVKLERWKNQFRDCHETTKVVFNSFGKTVFLTREEAESELAKMDGDGNGT